MSAEEDVMEWIHLEPSLRETAFESIQRKDNYTQTNNEDNNSKAMIKALQIENLHL